MFPVRDDNPQILAPIVTIAIVAANGLVWLLVQGLGRPDALVRSVCELGLIPAAVLGLAAPGTQVELGPGVACVLSDAHPWYTAVSSMFLHAGWLHLIGNMWFLWIFGNNVEDAMGHARFLAFYLLCGLVAAAFQVGLEPHSTLPMVGASGAIGGVMGAYVVLYPRVRVHMLVLLGFYVTTVAVPAAFMLGYWFLLQLLGGAFRLGAQAAGGTAFWAHVGGFAAGSALSFVFRNPVLLARHPYYGLRPPPPGRSFERRRGGW